MYYVYVFKDKVTNELYYGYTSNLEKRIKEHNRDKNKEIVYYEAYKIESDAHNRERRIKNYSQALTALKGRLKESLR